MSNSLKVLIGPAIIVVSLILMHTLDFFVPDIYFRPVPGLLIVFMLTPLVLDHTPDTFFTVLGALAITASAWYTRPSSEAFQITMVALLTAGVTGYISRQHQKAISHEKKLAEVNQGAADTMEALNGNIQRIQECRERILNVLVNPPGALSSEVADELRMVLHLLNNLELATNGWRALKKLILSINEVKSRVSDEQSTTTSSTFAS